MVLGDGGHHESKYLTVWRLAFAPLSPDRRAEMLFASGWAVVLSSRESYRGVAPDYVDAIDDYVNCADQELYARLEEFLAQHAPPDLLWTFRSHMNSARGILLMSSSRNHRCEPPTIVTVLSWLAQHAPASYGLVYLHDDEDTGVRTGTDNSNVFRVWRLLAGHVEELADPFLSSGVPLFEI
ncbi:MAG: hypothetical protein H6717_24275 [Polyangiaceae bacterium]|nr:hypothetical protein [Polyangiaceae bacterium]